MLLATRCPVCDAPGAAPCASCIAAMHRARPGPAPWGVDRCLALLCYEGAGRELVARFKYRNARGSLRWLADAVAGLVDEPVDIVVSVPTTDERRRARGFDHAELLARRVARRLTRRYDRVLVRQRGAPQTGADAATRRAARPVIVARRPVAGTVLLVDDVTTTGATLTAAAFALRLAGASRVVALVAASTPAPGDLH